MTNPISLAQAVIQSGQNTINHSADVVGLVFLLAKKLGCTDSDAKLYSFASQYHDIGKAYIPDEVINKPGPLTPSERLIIEKHSQYGSEILKQVMPHDVVAQQMAVYHHEHYNGSGYPRGLKGEEIPFFVRILTICDVYDALRCKRVYKTRMSHNQALDILQDSKDWFDPNIYNCFKSIEDKLLDQHLGYCEKNVCFCS